MVQDLRQKRIVLLHLFRQNTFPHFSITPEYTIKSRFEGAKLLQNHDICISTNNTLIYNILHTYCIALGTTIAQKLQKSSFPHFFHAHISNHVQRYNKNRTYQKFLSFFGIKVRRCEWI